MYQIKQLPIIVIDYFRSQSQEELFINRDNRLPHSVIDYQNFGNVEQGYFDQLNQL